MSNKTKLFNFCVKNLDLEQIDQFNDKFASISLCAIASVYSINTKYEIVENTIHRFCNYFGLDYASKSKKKLPDIEAQESTTRVYNLIQDISVEKLASDIFQNRQRTSTTNGILKADASKQFLKILKDFSVEYYQDIDRVINNNTFEACIKNIPGQSTGTSLKYFLMQTGSKDLIKPDRMILSFIKNATGEQVNADTALELIRSVVLKLKEHGYNDIYPRKLDNIIWNYQRNK